MKDTFWSWLFVILVTLFFSLSLVSVFSIWIGQNRAYVNCITYNEKLSVVEANSICDKIIYGGRK